MTQAIIASPTVTARMPQATIRPHVSAMNRSAKAAGCAPPTSQSMMLWQVSAITPFRADTCFEVEDFARLGQRSFGFSR